MALIATYTLMWYTQMSVSDCFRSGMSTRVLQPRPSALYRCFVKCQRNGVIALTANSIFLRYHQTIFLDVYISSNSSTAYPPALTSLPHVF